MGFELALIGVIWVAALTVFVAVAAVAGRSDQTHDGLLRVASRVSVVPVSVTAEVQAPVRTSGGTNVPLGV